MTGSPNISPPVGKRYPVDVLSGPDGRNTEGGSPMGLAGSRMTQEMDYLTPFKEGQFGEGHDPFPVKGGLEGEVKAMECLHR